MNNSTIISEISARLTAFLTTKQSDFSSDIILFNTDFNYEPKDQPGNSPVVEIIRTYIVTVKAYVDIDDEIDAVFDYYFSRSKMSLSSEYVWPTITAHSSAKEDESTYVHRFQMRVQYFKTIERVV
ncbi:MAG: hypothetical protein RBS96_05465 [Dehalococcoidales bacterium]|jgi:hypothetical protein|nr:hypothetical protein [Dehalococcoidales bacterium]